MFVYFTNKQIILRTIWMLQDAVPSGKFNRPHTQLTWTCGTVRGGAGVWCERTAAAPAARQGVAGRLVFLFLPALLALPNRNTLLPPPPLHTRCCCRASSCLSVVSCHLESNWTWNCRFSVCVCVCERQTTAHVCVCIWCVTKSS